MDLLKIVIVHSYVSLPEDKTYLIPLNHHKFRLDPLKMLVYQRIKPTKKNDLFSAGSFRISAVVVASSGNISHAGAEPMEHVDVAIDRDIPTV